VVSVFVSTCTLRKVPVVDDVGSSGSDVTRVLWVLRVMNRDPPSCAHDLRSSDSKSGSDGGTRGGPGGAAGICGFRILDVQNLRDGGDGTDLEPGTGFSRDGETTLMNISESK